MNVTDCVLQSAASCIFTPITHKCSNAETVLFLPLCSHQLDSYAFMRLQNVDMS
jgi:hypothetical protein